MKKTFKFIPLAIAPALLLMACANVASNDNNGLLTDTHNPSSDNASNASGITEYKVTVDFNGGLYKGESSYDFSVKKGTAYQYFKKNLPQEVGTDLVYADHELSFYSFDTGSSAAEIEDTYRFMDDVTIHAIYTPVDPSTTYTVTWLNNDGATVLLKEENKYHKSELPSYSGATPTPINPIEGVTYEFDGWTTPITPISDADQTYIAKYKETIVNTSTILFETDGGDSIPSMTLPVGTVLNKTDVPTAFKFGYVFQGWYLTSTQEVQYPYTVPDEDPIYFVAHYLPQLIEVSFDPAGGKWSDESTGVKKQKFNYNSMPFYTEDPTKEGSIFTGWSPKLVPVTEDAPKAYTATWESAPGPTATYTISFDANGGTPVAAQVIEVGSSIATKPVTSKTGYSTYDWYDGDNKVTFPYTPTANKTLVAHWTADKVTITFNPNGGTWGQGGTDPKPVEVDYNTMPTPPGTLTRSGYTFTGWDATLEPATAIKTYTAQWSTYKRVVTFDSQGGSSIAAKEVDYGATVADPGAPTYPGHDFNGWYTAKTGGTKWTFATDTVTSNITLYAQWGALRKIDVVFYDSDGVEITTVPTDYGAKVTRPEDPKKDGKVFDGWVTEKGGSTPFDFDAPITDDSVTTAFATWKDETYTIRWFNTDRTRDLLETDKNVTKGTIPTYDGATPTLAPDSNHRYKFSGWSPTILPVDADMSYYATYDYDDEIAFSYESDFVQLNDEFNFETVETYGGFIVFNFDDSSKLDDITSRAKFKIGATTYTYAQLSGANGVQITQGSSGTMLSINISLTARSELINASSIEMEVMMYE